MEITLKSLLSTMCFVTWAAVVSAQPGPGDIDLRSLLSGGGQPLTAPLTLGERVQGESDSLAAASDAVLREAGSHHLEYQTHGKTQNDAQGRALLARRRQFDLVLEKDRALAEMRQGAFCRACRRTRSQVQAAGEDWQHHLDANSQGRAVSATPQELSAKALEFDGLITQAKAQESQAITQASAAAQAKAAAAQAVIRAFPRWKRAMLTEDDGRAKAWDAAIRTYKDRFDTYERHIQKLDGDIARARSGEVNRDLVQRLDSQREEAAAMMRQLAKEAQADYFSRRTQDVTFDQRLAAGRKQLETFVQEVGGPPMATLASFTSGILSPPPLEADVPGTDFSVAIGGGSLGLSGSLGLFKMSLRASEDWLRDKMHVDVVMGFAPWRVEGGIRNTTDWSGSGATLTTTPIGSLPKPVELPDPVELLMDPKGPR